MSTLTDDDELLAAELALGLLDHAERHEAEARLDRDADFAEAHARWQDRAAALFVGASDAPDEAVWHAIDARLASNDRGETPVSRSRLRLWQGAAVAACAAALVLGVLALRTPSQVVVEMPVAQAPSPPLVAVLTGKKGFVTVSYDRSAKRLTAAASGLDTGDHVAELWVIPAGGKPRSLGVIDAQQPNWKKVPEAAAPALAAGATIAVSIEPSGGSATGQPTGPVVLTGQMRAI